MKFALRNLVILLIFCSFQNRIEFDRPLRTDVRLEWNPELIVAENQVEEVGIEGLAFEFPNTPYLGHFTELGFNAVAIQGARNCWVRNLKIHNADSGIFVSGTIFFVDHVDGENESRAPSERREKGSQMPMPAVRAPPHFTCNCAGTRGEETFTYSTGTVQ